MKTKTLVNVAFIVAMLFLIGFTSQVYALPALQLGPGETGTWNYNTGDDTWFVDESLFTLSAYANASDTGANGDYAWNVGGGDQTAYLVASAVPKNSPDGSFNITVMNDSSTLTVFDSGIGKTLLPDEDDTLSPHGIFPTYFEIYEFQFDGLVDTIFNTQPPEAGGDSGSGQGYTETFDITIDWLASEVSGIHFDLFTKDTGGIISFAPYSHDAQASPVPEPATMLLLGSGLIGLAGFGRKKFRKK